MKQISGKAFCKILEAHGWTRSRVSGSHHIYIKTGHKERIVVPVHVNKPLKIGLLKAQMKLAGIHEREL